MEIQDIVFQYFLVKPYLFVSLFRESLWLEKLHVSTVHCTYVFVKQLYSDDTEKKENVGSFIEINISSSDNLCYRPQGSKTVVHSIKVRKTTNLAMYQLFLIKNSRSYHVLKSDGKQHFMRPQINIFHIRTIFSTTKLQKSKRWITNQARNQSLKNGLILPSEKKKWKGF